MHASQQHILIVDDSEDDALLITSRLRRALPNPRFRRVDTEEAMREALDSQQWDLVISDHLMPRFDSQRALELLKKTDRDIPFIIFSGTLPEQIGLNAMSTGARDYVDKANAAKLVPVVKRELGNASLRKAKEEAERDLIELTFYDPLTKLPNREMLAKLINASLVRKPPGELAALVFIDLDRFMRVNQSFGYPTGDQLLGCVAERLQKHFDQCSIVARLGQDRFAVFLDHADTQAQVAEEVSRMSELLCAPFLLCGEEFFMTFSVGVCLYPEHGVAADTLIRNAEIAKFAAKKLGPGNISFYTRDTHLQLGNPLRIENALRHAVARNELFLLYQPCLCLASGRVDSCEALLRWRHPQLGIIPPDTLIPIADDTGLIVEIGRWVLLAACRQAQQWQREGLDLAVAINVSAAQFRKPGLADDVAGVLAHVGLDARLLELEITETVIMQDAEATITTLRRLKRMGVRIAIDDFGTGYSSLSYLKRFPIDSLKVDKSFVHDLTVDADDKAIVATIIGLARNLKLAVVAEGVETADQLEYLREQGCDRMQGYLLSPPIPPAALAALAVNANPLG